MSTPLVPSPAPMTKMQIVSAAAKGVGVAGLLVLAAYFAVVKHDGPTATTILSVASVLFGVGVTSHRGAVAAMEAKDAGEFNSRALVQALVDLGNLRNNPAASGTPLTAADRTARADLGINSTRQS